MMNKGSRSGQTRQVGGTSQPHPEEEKATGPGRAPVPESATHIAEKELLSVAFWAMRTQLAYYKISLIDKIAQTFKK